MSTVIVHVKTDHSDHVQAAESVRNSMVRAGYDVEDVRVLDSTTSQEVYVHTNAIVTVVEPEVALVGKVEL